MDRIERFFDNYADALNNRSVERMSALSIKPMIFVSDDKKQICNTQKEIDQVNQLLLDGLIKGGVTRHQPQVTQSMRLSDSVTFVRIRWGFKDDSDTVLFHCYCSYTLQVENADTLKILIAVLDDEHKILTSLMN